MSECARAKRIVDLWERGETVSAEELAILEAHAPSCAECSRSILPAIPFIARDVRGARSARHAVAPALAEPSAGFTDAVMKDVGQLRPRATRRPALFPLAAAAFVLLAVGIGFVAFRVGAGNGGSEEVLVRFELVAPGARSVAVVGSFTQWQTSRLEMRDANGDGVWEAALRLRKGAVYTYNFVVDGSVWIADPNAPAQVDDGFGGQSSVMEL